MTGKSLSILCAILGLQGLVSSHENVFQRQHPYLSFVRYMMPGSYFSNCGGHAACLQLPIDPELSSADLFTFNLTENQVKALCKDIRDTTLCHMQHTDCVPGNLQPIIEPIKLALTKRWEICNDSNLYADFLAIESCARLIEEKYWIDFVSPAGMSAPMPFQSCVYVAMVAGKSAYDELLRTGLLGPASESQNDAVAPRDHVRMIEPARLLHGICCAGKSLAGCGITTLLGETCTRESVTAIKRQLDNTLDALNCSAITATRPCPLTFSYY